VRRPRAQRALLPPPATTAPRPEQRTGASDAFLAVQQQAGNVAVSSLLENAPALPGLAADVGRPGRAAGESLPEELRAGMESSFATDLGDVRLHEGGAATQLTSSLRARAITSGDDIYLSPDAPDPGSVAGHQLLAHELAHVVQQRGAGPATEDITSRPGDRSELAADRAAEAATRGEAAPDVGRATAPVQGDWLGAVMRPIDLGAIQELLGAAAPESPAPAPEPELGTLGAPIYAYSGQRFDALYVPNGPEPETGELTIVLKVHVDFQDFTEELRTTEPYADEELTDEDLADMTWSDADKARFTSGFTSSVTSAWSDKYQLVLDEAGFAPYRTDVKVQVEQVDDPGSAHNKITALKVPAGLPRFRSFVQGDTSTLELRDVDEEETHNVQPVDRIRQIQPFGFDSDEITPELDAQIEEAAAMVRRRSGQPADASGPLPPEANGTVFVRGRSSTQGDESYNQRLGQRRASAVDERLKSLIPGLGTQILTGGEQDATEEERFQRVDLALDFDVELEEATQNVAAHEAGHMMGLDDEYIDAELHRLAGDLPEHLEDVGTLMGPEAADELRVQNSHSIMSVGGTVAKGHYVYFLQALNEMTDKRWKVE